MKITLDAGSDAALFRLNSGGYLRFRARPDFDRPADIGQDNLYRVRLLANDGKSVRAQNVSITVTNIDESAPTFRTSRIASGLNQPLFVLGRGDGSDRVFVLEKAGRILILDVVSGALNAAPFLDLAGTISTDGEGGLLGMALAPDFATSGEFYVHVTGLDGASEIRSFRATPTDPDRADAASGDVILAAARPTSTHIGGWIGFGPDGFLYIAFGDGGGANDPFRNAQNLNSLLGTILRIDPSSDGFPADPLRDYAIPSSNPFAAGASAPETFAYGLRNPFRASFDRATGNLFIGDVGQEAIEEIDLIRTGEAGLNFGWPILEGTRTNEPGATAGMSAPIAEYYHGTGLREGNSITGGYVYRGSVATLRGRYLFGDFINNHVRSVRSGALQQGVTLAATSFGVRSRELEPDAGRIAGIASFGEDYRGEVYLISIEGEIFRIVPK